MEKKDIKRAKKEISKQIKCNKKYQNIKKEKVQKVIKLIVIGVVIAFCIVLVLVLINGIVENKSKYMITNGKIESTSVMDTYIAREEQVIETDLSKPILALIPHGERVAKNQIVAYYKDSEHIDSQNNLEKIDEEIYNAVQTLPKIYSGDIKNIEEKIEETLETVKGVDSYLDISEKTKEIKNLLLEKVTIQAKLSPEGANIVNLLNEREKLNAQISNLSSNIKATKSGIVAYKIDGLEEALKYSNITDYSYIKNQVDSKEEIQKFGIKIVNNFKAFLYFSANKSQIPSNLEKGSRYVIRLLDENNDEIIGRVIDINADENNSEVILEISTGIEKLLNRRKFNCEFVWWEYEGMKVPKTALFKEKDINYVNVIEYGEYIKIPVKIVKENKKFAIIENFKAEELEELKIEYNGKVKMYDEVLINKNN